MNIVVLAGGYSPERDVSLTSGSLIANSLISRGHRVLFMCDGDIAEDGTPDEIFNHPKHPKLQQFLNSVL